MAATLMINLSSRHDLHRADRAIAAAEKRVLEQAALVARLEVSGRDPLLAEGLLGEMEMTLNALRAQRELILIGSATGRAAAEPQV